MFLTAVDGYHFKSVLKDSSVRPSKNRSALVDTLIMMKTTHKNSSPYTPHGQMSAAVKVFWFFLSISEGKRFPLFDIMRVCVSDRLISGRPRVCLVVLQRAFQKFIHSA